MAFRSIGALWTHNDRYVALNGRYGKSQAFGLAAVFRSGRHDMDARCVNAAVSRDIRQLGGVLPAAVKGAGSQLAQVTGEPLAGRCAPAGRCILPNERRNPAILSVFFLFLQLF